MELSRSGWGCAVRSGGRGQRGGCDPVPKVTQMTQMGSMRVERIGVSAPSLKVFLPFLRLRFTGCLDLVWIGVKN